MAPTRRHFACAAAPAGAGRPAFLDGAGVRTATARPQGRSLGGGRRVGRAPGGHDAGTLPGATAVDGPLPGGGVVFESGVNGAVFRDRVGRRPAPNPTAGQVAVTDGRGSRRVAGVAEAVESAGRTARCLPACGPDPTGKSWSEVRTAVRAAAARTAEDLRQAVGAARKTVTAEDCPHWCRHCGHTQ